MVHYIMMLFGRCHQQLLATMISGNSLEDALTVYFNRHDEDDVLWEIIFTWLRAHESSTMLRLIGTAIFQEDNSAMHEKLIRWFDYIGSTSEHKIIIKRTIRNNIPILVNRIICYSAKAYPGNNESYVTFAEYQFEKVRSRGKRSPTKETAMSEEEIQSIIDSLNWEKTEDEKIVPGKYEDDPRIKFEPPPRPRRSIYSEYAEDGSCYNL
jgi:hypothetical protein